MKTHPLSPRVISLLLICSLFWAVPGGQAELLAKFDITIDGESAVKSHVKWLNFDSMAFNVGRAVSQETPSSPRDTSTPSFSEFEFTRKTDSASPKLFIEAVSGSPRGKMTIHQTQELNGQVQVPIVIILHEAIISSYSVTSEGENPEETINVNYTKISYQVNGYVNGVVTNGVVQTWDLIKNESF